MPSGLSLSLSPLLLIYHYYHGGGNITAQPTITPSAAAFAPLRPTVAVSPPPPLRLTPGEVDSGLRRRELHQIPPREVVVLQQQKDLREKEAPPTVSISASVSLMDKKLFLAKYES